MPLSPIILFVYNRLDHTRQTVEALQKNELAAESTLYIFADGAKENATNEQRQKVQSVRDYIHTITGFKEIIINEAPRNKGLANSIISGVTAVVNEHGKAIVLEDDLVTHVYFLRYMNEALDFYEDDHRIFSIGATSYNIGFPKDYKHDVYIAHRSESCGWGTWSNRWNLADWEVKDFNTFITSPRQIKKFNRGGNDMTPMLQSQLNGKIDSWAIRWDYCMYKYDAYCLRPTMMLIQNIGFDGSGIHSGDTLPPNYYTAFYNSQEYDIRLVKGIKPNATIERNFKKFQSPELNITYFTQIKRFIKRVCRLVKLHVGWYV